AAPRAGLSAAHAAGVLCDHRAHGDALHQDAQGLFPDRRFRLHHRCDAGVGGPGGAATSNRGTMFISLKPPAERNGVSTAAVIDRLRRQIFNVPGIRLFMFAAQDVRAGGRQSDSDYQYTLSSTDLDLLQKWAPIVSKRMESVEGITDVSSDRDPGGLQLTLAIDRQKASSLGVR